MGKLINSVTGRTYSSTPNVHEIPRVIPGTRFKFRDAPVGQNRYLRNDICDFDLLSTYVIKEVQETKLRWVVIDERTNKELLFPLSFFENNSADTLVIL